MSQIIKDFSSVTEIPGKYISKEELDMICCRYVTASQYTEGKDVLEVGCGAGLGLGYLSRMARRIVGGDYTEDNLIHAKNYYGGAIEFIRLDAQSLPIKKQSFDVVLLFEVIFYLSEPELFLRECRRILKKNGVLIICLPNKEAPVFRPSPLSTKYFSAAELYDLLARYNFKVEVFGAFPIERLLLSQKIISGIRFLAANVLNYTSFGRRLKESLKKPVLGRDLVLQNEIDDTMSGKTPLVPVSAETHDYRHRIIYVIAEVG